MNRYICKCGKSFETAQGLRGHKTFCKIYLGEERYRINCELNAKKFEKSNLYKQEQAKIRKQQKLQQWLDEKHKCENCGKIMTEYYGSGRFCSAKCARGFSTKNNRKEISQKVSNKMKGNVIPWNKGLTYENDKLSGLRWTDEQRFKHSIKMKEVMNRPEVKLKISETSKGRTLSEESRKKISEKVKASFEDGRNQAWKTRKNMESYAEKFWRQVLDSNNISYKQEFRIARSEFGLKHGGCYFLDFLIDDKIDLEIDGKQHYELIRQEHDKERDKLMKSKGYIVYRIKFINPSNSVLVEKQINDFLNWYNTVKTTYVL